MNLPVYVKQDELTDVLLNIASARPVFIWGAPGIGKSALVEQFAEDVGLPCVSLLGSQLAPEDIIGIPQIKGDVSEFLPPAMIARKEPYVLFLDELNACSQEVQKAFYSLISEAGSFMIFRRTGSSSTERSRNSYTALKLCSKIFPLSIWKWRRWWSRLKESRCFRNGIWSRSSAIFLV